MKFSTLLFLIALGVGALVAAAPAAAQGGRCGDVARVLEDLRRQEERIRSRVSECVTPEARTLLNRAGQSLREADESAGRGLCQRAQMQARFAKGLLDRAVRLCEEGDAYRERLLDMLRETDERVREAADTALRSDVPMCRGLAEAARRQASNAHRRFRAEDHRVALTLTLGARELAERALRCAEAGGLESGAGVERELERTDRLLAEVRRVLDDMDDPGAATDLLGDATRLQTEARRQSVSAPGLAVRLTLQARGMASRALARVEVDLSADDIRPMLDSTGELLDKLRAAAVDDRDSRLGERLRRARRLLDEAESALSAGDVRESWAKLRASSALALEAASRLGPGGGP